MPHFLGIVALGKYPAAPFHLRGQAPAVEEEEQVFVIKLFIGAVEEFPVSRGLCDEIHDGGAVCQVAAALAGDAHLEAHLRHFFKKQDLRPCPCCGDSGQEAGYAAADDGDPFSGRAHIIFEPPPM